ncbi:MAG: Fe-S cluster assembly protein HesB [Microbacteriaceae bacterium]
MLTLTENAIAIVKTIAAQTPGAEHDGGLRISTTDAEGPDFTVAITPAPEPSDEVVESAGARVFLQENAALVLSDKVLDAQIDDAGAVRFALAVA